MIITDVKDHSNPLPSGYISPLLLGRRIPVFAVDKEFTIRVGVRSRNHLDGMAPFLEGLAGNVYPIAKRRQARICIRDESYFSHFEYLSSSSPAVFHCA